MELERDSVEKNKMKVLSEQDVEEGVNRLVYGGP